MILGLTGGIGSGKTTTAGVFKVIGVPVYNADERARFLIQEDHIIREGYKQLFGDDIYSDDGLNRKEVANRVFKDPVLLERVNQLVHPVVNNDFKGWCEKHKTARLVVKEAAILFESGGFKYLDFNVLVMAPLELRIKRVMRRDGVSQKQVEERINNQWPDSKKRDLADYIIKCDEETLVLSQVFNLLKKLNIKWDF
jgi:dephospho-CoA kinase